MVVVVVVVVVENNTNAHTEADTKPTPSQEPGDPVNKRSRKYRNQLQKREAENVVQEESVYCSGVTHSRKRCAGPLLFKVKINEVLRIVRQAWA